MKSRKMYIIIASLLAVPLCTLLLTSCPSPLDSVNLSIMKDQSAPVITISSPSQESEYESSITIRGIIIDLDNSGDPRSADAGSYIQSASYIVLNHETESTEIEVSDDGDFSFSLGTTEYSTQISIYISTEDLNGNESNKTLTLNPDTDGPYLLVTSPDDYSEYATVIELKGYAVNSIDDNSTSELDDTIAYSISGSSISGTIAIDTDDGSFAKTIDVSTVNNSTSLEVTAADLNSNETSVVINIQKPSGGGDISSFTLTPGNGQVVLSWDEVPYSESYSIYQYDYSTSVEVDNGTTSYTWTGLTNGNKYTFQLTAVIPDSLGDDAVSAKETTIPLSTRSLAPWIKEVDYNSITIEWQENSLVDGYTVERSTSSDGPWVIV